jgi:hypothetical protein
MDAPNWGELDHAYGSAEDLPDKLAGLEPDQGARVWEELWSCVCHQGTTYSASPYVLPHLLEAATGWPAAGRVMPLSLASSIVLSREFVAVGFEDTVRRLHALAAETVRVDSLDQRDRIYVMSAALVLGGDAVWGSAFERLNDGEILGSCPFCEEDLVFAIRKGRLRATAGHDTEGSAILAADASHLPDTGRWMWENSGGDEVLRGWIVELFGATNCGSCGELVQVAEAIELYERKSMTAGGR